MVRKREHLAALVGEHLGQLLDILGRHAGKLGGVLQGVGGQTRGEGFESDGLHIVDGLADVALVVAVVGGVADVLGALLELHVVGHEVVVVLVVHDEVVRDGVGDGDVAARAEGEHLVGRGRGASGHGGHVVVAHGLVGELAGRQARVQHGMGLGHVGAPGDEDVGLVDVGVAAGRLVGLEDVHEAHDGRGHAQTRVGVDVVGEQARLPELRRAVALHDGLLAASPERQAALVGLPRVAELARHQIERLVPGGLAQAVGRALGGLVVTDERGGQAILAVQRAGQVVALHAVQATARAVLRVARDRDHLAVLGLHDDAAAAAAETAHAHGLHGVAARGCRVPAGAGERRAAGHGAGSGRRGEGHGGALNEGASSQFHLVPPFRSRAPDAPPSRIC